MLVRNPNDAVASVEMCYLTPTGIGNVVFNETVPANSRKSLSIADRLPRWRTGVMFKSETAGKKIMVERAMYWKSCGAGTDTIGEYGE